MIGERLAEIRKMHGDTQQTLATYLNVSISTIRSWEQEKSSPPHEMLVSICKHYQVSSDYLLGLSNIDPIDVRRTRLERFTQQELNLLSEYESFLLWRRGHR